MTSPIASLPPKPLPASPPPGGSFGLEDESLSIAEDGQFWSTEDGPTFSEFLDIINPLHHIPVISTIYRAITGDEIGAGPRFVGGMIFGGPIGALAAGVTALFEEATGGDLGAHLAEMVDEVTGGRDAAPAIAAAGTQTDKQTQQAAVPATAPQIAAALRDTESAAQHLNRISLNPAAALGVAQNRGAVQAANPQQALNADDVAPPPAVRRRTARLPDRAKIFPAHPATAGAAAAMQVPFGGNRPDSKANAAAQQAAPRMNDAVARSRRQQTDLMLAQWAAQQMAQQKGASGVKSPAEDKKDGEAAENRAANAPAHPMLPPRGASPEWYAQAMDKALNQYRAGGKTLPAGVPALSVTR